MKTSDPGIFLVGRLITDSISFLSNWPFQIFYFPMIQSWHLYVSRDLSISFRLSNLLVYNYSWYSRNLFISVKMVIRSFFISDFFI